MIRANDDRKRPMMLRQLRAHPAGVIAILWVIGWVVACAFANQIAPFPENEQDLRNVLAGPTWNHLLGTDTLGRDVFSRLLYGGSQAFVGVLEACVVAVVIGIPAGIAAGYLRGATEAIGSRIAEILLALPSFIILLLVFAIFPTGRTLAMVVLGIMFAPTMYRVARSVTLQAAGESYIKFAEVSRIGRFAIMWRHLLPRVAPPAAISLSIIASFALIIQSGLAFLNFGVEPPAASWGSMLKDAESAISQSAWLMVPPSAMMAFLVIAFVTIGDATRDTLAHSKRAAVKSAPSTTYTSSEASTARTVPLSPDDAGAEPPQLVVENLTIVRSGVSGDDRAPLVTDISFTLNRGESIAIVGESGCGKSITGLSIIGMLPHGLQVEGGKCWYNGEDLVTAGEGRLRQIRGKEIAYISQDPMVALDPCYRVGNQLREGIRRHTKLSKTDVEKRAIALLRAVQLRDTKRIMRSYPHELSGGMAQRVCIALALAGSPKVLIADEATTSLDVTVQREILDLLHAIKAERDLSLILITHDLSIVQQMCDKTLVAYAGDVVEYGLSSRVMVVPQHPYTALLLGCELRTVRRGETFPDIDGTVPRPGDWPTGCRFQQRCPIVTESCAEAQARDVRTCDGSAVRCVRPGDLKPGSASSHSGVGAAASDGIDEGVG